MLRTNGKYKFYQIKARWLDKRKGDNWFLHTDYYQPKIENTDIIRDDFTASGQCWQITGQHGVFNVRNALKGLEVSKAKMKEFPDKKGYEVELSIFEVKISQKQKRII